jgi:signal transduction histidine kinase
MDPLVESFLEQSPLCLCVISQQETGGPRFERVWGHGEALFGLPPSALAGKALRDVLPPPSVDQWYARCERALAGEVLLLRERREGTVWNLSVFRVLIPGRKYVGAICREVTKFGTAEQELRHTVLSALKAQEFERTIMSRFLHDSIGQNLTALGLQLDLIRMDTENASAEVSARLADAQKLLGEMMEAVREYSYELHPATVERAGLRAAMDRLVSRIRERFPGTIRLNADPSLKVEPDVGSALYQIATEAVSNAVQHSGCTVIDIAVRTTRQGIALEVRDNGRGFDPDDVLGSNRGLGLLSMEHYAAQAGLELSIVSAGDLGTTVRATRE